MKIKKLKEFIDLYDSVGFSEIERIDSYSNDNCISLRVFKKFSKFTLYSNLRISSETIQLIVQKAYGRNVEYDVNMWMEVKSNYPLEKFKEFILCNLPELEQ